MKELSIEEKAKAYNNVREKIAIRFGSNVAEEIFSEYEESEDERMVKFIKKQLFNIKKTITENYELDAKLTKAIDWLEKQSTPQVRTGLEWVNTIDDACDKRYSEKYAHGEYCHEQSFKWGFQEGVDWLEKQGNNMGISKATKQKLEDSLNEALEKETSESFNAFLDEQGEQKQDVNIQINPSEYINDMGGNGCYLKNTAQKPADKVELKFKVGDIIRLKDGDGLEWTVEEVLDNGCYTIVCTDRDDFIQLDDKWELVDQKPAWKPSDDEMEALEGVINSLPHQKILYGLYQDLKKLRGK